MKKAFTKKQRAQRAAEERSRQEGLMNLHHEIFSQLMQIPQAARWIEQNIRIEHDVDQESKTIDIKVMYIGGPGQDEDQFIAQCPGCGLKFDANQRISQITLATKIPDGVKLPGE